VQRHLSEFVNILLRSRTIGDGRLQRDASKGTQLCKRIMAQGKQEKRGKSMERENRTGHTKKTREEIYAEEVGTSVQRL
jgi:hypothetical protein